MVAREGLGPTRQPICHVSPKIEANEKDKGEKMGRSIWILLLARAKGAELQLGRMLHAYIERNPFKSSKGTSNRPSEIGS
jgi:hypothetical protein